MTASTKRTFAPISNAPFTTRVIPSNCQSEQRPQLTQNVPQCRYEASPIVPRCNIDNTDPADIVATCIALNQNGYSARFVSQLIPGLPSGFSGVLDISAECRIDTALSHEPPRRFLAHYLFRCGLRPPPLISARLSADRGWRWIRDAVHSARRCRDIQGNTTRKTRPSAKSIRDARASCRPVRPGLRTSSSRF